MLSWLWRGWGRPARALCKGQASQRPLVQAKSEVSARKKSQADKQPLLVAPSGYVKSMVLYICISGEALGLKRRD